MRTFLWLLAAGLTTVSMGGNGGSKILPDRDWQAMVALSSCLKSFESDSQHEDCVAAVRANSGALDVIFKRVLAERPLSPSVVEAALSLILAPYHMPIYDQVALTTVLDLPRERFTSTVRDALMRTLDQRSPVDRKIAVMCRFVKGTRCANPDSDLQSHIEKQLPLAPEAKLASFRKIMRRFHGCAQRIDANPIAALFVNSMGPSLVDCQYGDMVHQRIVEEDLAERGE